MSKPDMLAIAVLTTSLLVWSVFSADAETIYYLPFDSAPTMSLSAGAAGISGADAGKYVRGKREKALMLGENGEEALTYSFDKPLVENEGAVEFWMQPLTWQGKDKVETFGLTIIIDDGRIIRCFKDDASSRFLLITTENDKSAVRYIPIYDLRAGEWQQLVIVIKSGETELYLNGEKAASWDGTLAMRAATGGKSRNSISFHATRATAIDELRIYNRAFTPSEVEERYITACLGKVNYRSPVVRIPYTRTAPDPDGGIDLDAWEEAAVVSDFVNTGDGRKFGQQTWVHLMYDDNRMYILYRSPVLKGGLVGGPRQLDELNGGDEIELFVMPKYTETFDFYQFIGNPWESIFDSLGRAGRNWTGDWRYRCRVDDKWWYAEVWINDYSVLSTGSPVTGGVWTGNFCRNWRSGSGGWTQWAHTPPAYHNFKGFGTFIFGGRHTVIPCIGTIADIDDTGVEAVFKLVNTATEEKNVVMKYEFYPAGDYLPLTVDNREVALRPGNTQPFRLRCEMGSFRMGLVEMQISDAGSGEIYFRQMVNIGAGKESAK